jgi:hypothetical protein
VATSDQAAASTANQLVLPSGSAYKVRGQVVARNASNGDMAGWDIS